jgi:polyisoprenoid-binding protein YceI
MIVDEAARVIDGMPVPAAGILTIDPAHSSIGFHVRHLMIAKVTGRFTTFSGTIHVEADPEQSWAEVSIDAASIDTADPQRDQHLRSADFLDAEQFPTIEFRSTGLRRKQGKAFDVAGDLTMHGVTRSVAVACEYQGIAADPWGNQRAVISARTEINRGDWGLTWNQALESGGVLVGSQITIQAEIQAIPQRSRPEKQE